MQVLIEGDKLICPYCKQEFNGHNTDDYDSIVYQGQRGVKFVKRCSLCSKEVDFYKFGLSINSNGEYKAVKEDEVKKIDSKKIDKEQGEI